MARFDWAALVALGMVELGLSPAEFWALTPAELALLLGQRVGPGPLGRSGLDALMARFPDRETGDDDHGRG